MQIGGVVRTGIRTKELVKQLCKNEIAVINHNDIDVLSAVSLINTGVTTIINTGRSMTGRTETSGAQLLLNNKVMLYDVSLPFEIFKDSDSVLISGSSISINGISYKKCCRRVNSSYIHLNANLSRLNRYDELYGFINNSLEHAKRDIDVLLRYNSYPDIDTNIKKKHVLVVSRNTNSMEELDIIDNYILRKKPVLIGVDGGADLLLNAGYIPDILIGDMDSVSDLGIRKSKEIVLHTYPNGNSPFIYRLAGMNKAYKRISIPGTSEDMALLLAYHKGAERILLAGGHSSMEDFIAKGRNGMGSTIISRLIVSNRLIDLKNITSLSEKEIYLLKSIR